MRWIDLRPYIELCHYSGDLTINMATGERIRERRKAMSLSQVELARRAGISRQALGAIEADVYQPTVGVALSLARELGKGVEDLFGDAEASEARQLNARW